MGKLHKRRRCFYHMRKRKNNNAFQHNNRILHIPQVDGVSTIDTITSGMPDASQNQSDSDKNDESCINIANNNILSGNNTIANYAVVSDVLINNTKNNRKSINCANVNGIKGVVATGHSPLFINSTHVPKAAICSNNPLQCAKWLKNGHIIAYPSESVWGMGCNPFCNEALDRLFALKARQNKAFIVITDDIKNITPFLQPLAPHLLQKITHSWQETTVLQKKQATTWLFDVPKNLPVPIPGALLQDNKLAIRVVPKSIGVLCAPLKSAQNPYAFLVSTSANPKGAPPAISTAMVQGYFNQSVRIFLGQSLGLNAPSAIFCASTGRQLR